METLLTFEDLLPIPIDPGKSAMRDQLIQVLNSQEEILPSANSPRGKLWHLVNSPDASIQECADIVQLDTALASRIFRVANSGAYGVQTENISDAIRHLGLKFVREQVFNAGVFKQYSGWILPPEWDLFWLRNIFVARLCERIASTYGSTNGSEYLCGLIHDIGWLFLATYLPDEYTNLFASGRPVAEMEIEILPFSHADLAGAIAARSLLPARAIEAIVHHHDSLTSPDLEESARFLAAILAISDQIADSLQMNMFSHADLTLEEIQQGPEIEWLSQFGTAPDLQTFAQEELLKSQQIFEVFFSNRKFN